MDEKIVLYSSHCPNCKALEKKLNNAGIRYEIFDDVDAMVAKGFNEAPKLEVDGVIYGYVDAVQWIKERYGR